VLLVDLVRGRHDTAGQRGFTQLHFSQLRFFLHSNPSKFADEMKNFHRLTLMILRGGDFSTLQIDVHVFLPQKVAARAILAIARSSPPQMGTGT